MPLVAPRRSLNGCSCERRGTRARGGLHGLGALGDTSLPSADQVKNLQSQINRFDSSAPPGLAIQPTPLPITGVVDLPTAQAAMAVLVARLTWTLPSLPSANDTIQSQLQLLYAAYASDPVGYVLANFSTVLATIQQYADSLKLASATPLIVTQVIDALGGERNAVMVLGGAALLFYYLGGK